MAKKAANPWPSVLEELRDRMKWSQEDAAAEVGVSRRQWIRWEKDTLPIGPSIYALRCMVRTHAPDLLKKLPE